MLPLLVTLLLADARATVVSRLGDVYLYDPVSFDGGVIQRGSYTRGRVESDRSALSAGVDLPFFRELSLRLGYTQSLLYEGRADPLGVDWRLRMPVLESIRFGRLTSSGFYYSGSAALGAAHDPLVPHHELGPTLATSRTWRRSHSLHAQGGPAFRERGEDPLGAVGAVLRFAHLVQIYVPPPGLGITATASLSTVELEWIQFGLGDGREGLLRGGFLGPTLHITPRTATYSLGLLPTASLRYGERTELGIGAAASFTVTYRPDWE